MVYQCQQNRNWLFCVHDPHPALDINYITCITIYTDCSYIGKKFKKHLAHKINALKCISSQDIDLLYDINILYLKYLLYL